MNNEKFSITRVIIFSVIALLVAFTIGYYIGNDHSRRATVVPSTKDGLVDQRQFITQDKATKECNFRITAGNNNEAKALIIDKLKLDDIESYKVIGSKIFYSTGPVYGKPEIGIIDCLSALNKTIVFPENKQGAYPYGSDYFRLKKVTKLLGANAYNIQYYYEPDVDKIDFKNFENDSHLKVFKYLENEK